MTWMMRQNVEEIVAYFKVNTSTWLA